MTSKQKWTLEKIQAGIEHYKNLYGKYPSILDFNKVDFLPTARMVQRNFGGIVKLREKLNIDSASDYTKGEHRSSIARNTYARAVDYEEAFYNFLINKIPEVQVHEHKILRPGRVCCDFFVYTTDTRGVAIDLFYAQDLYSLGGVVNIKLKRYAQITYKTFFILVGNNNISMEEIERLLENRKALLPKHIRVVTESFFKEKVFELIEELDY